MIPFFLLNPILHLFFLGGNHLRDVYINDIEAIKIPSYNFYFFFALYFIILCGYHGWGVLQKVLAAEKKPEGSND